MKKILLIILAIAFTVSSCEDYDSEFLALNKSIAELQAQVSGFSTLQASLTTLTSSVASLQTAVNALPKTQVDITGLQASLTAQAALINTLQTNLNTVIANYATSANLATAQASITALAAQLATAQANLNTLLAANNVYTGDLNIRNAAELTFAQGLSANLSVINGAVRINNTNISAAAVSAITKNILSVTGLVEVVAVADVDLSKLTSVGGAYTVNTFDISDQALTSVGGNVVLNYDGGYKQPMLANVDGTVTLTNFATVTGTSVGTLAVDFSGLATTGLINAGTVDFTVATSVKLNAGVSSVTAAKANTVDLLAANYKTGLTISATKAGSVVTIAGRVDNGAASPVGQALSVTGDVTSVLNAKNVVKVGVVTVTAKTVDFTAMTNATSIALTSTTPVAFPALKTSGAITANTATSFVAPLLDVSAALSLTLATTIEVTNLPTATLTPLTKVKTLTLNGQKVPYTDALTVIETFKAVGVPGATNGVVFGAASATMKSFDVSGTFSSVSVTGLAALTSFITAGQINAVTVDDCDALTALTLGHTTITGLNYSDLVIQNNAELTSLTSTTNHLRTLTVKTNAKLATMNFASYTSVLSSGTIAIDITGNKLAGNYVNAVAASGSNPYVQTVITNASLTTLKPFVNAYKAALAASPAATTATISLVVDMADASTASGTQTLGAMQSADTAHTPAYTLNGVLTGVAEFLLIQ